MNGRFITAKTIAEFKEQLILEEKSKITVEKYIRDVKAFANRIYRFRLKQKAQQDIPFFEFSSCMAFNLVITLITSLCHATTSW